MPGSSPPPDAQLQENACRGSGAAADAAAAAYTARPPPPLPLPPGLTVEQLRGTLRPAQRGEVQRAVNEMEKSMRSISGMHHLSPVTKSEGWTPQGVPGGGEPENVLENKASSSSSNIIPTSPAPASNPKVHSSITPVAVGGDPFKSETSGDHEVREKVPDCGNGKSFEDAVNSALKDSLFGRSALEHSCSSAQVVCDGPPLEFVCEATKDVPPTTQSNPAQEPPCPMLIDPVSSQAPYLWEVQSNAKIVSQITSLLTDMTSLSAECDRLYESLQCESVDAEQLHEVTQRLVDRFGCRNQEALEKIGTIYAAAAMPKGGANAEGMGLREFRGYVAAVLNQDRKSVV